MIGALNGDVDNHADLKALHRPAGRPRDHHRRQGHPRPREPPARRRRRRRSRRSAPRSPPSRAPWPSPPTPPPTPDRVLLALRGSGQALYVGLAEDAFVVASEPYGLVEETATYLRMDGETPADLDNPNASRGQVVALDRRRAGTVEGISRLAYDGTPAARRRTASSPPPRSPPATSTAASTRTSCSRRSARRRRRSARRCGASSSTGPTGLEVHLGEEALPPAIRRAASPTARIAPGDRHRPGHRRGGSPVARRRPRRPSSPTPTCRVEAQPGHRAVRLRHARRHVRHAGGRHLASPAPPPTPTAPSTSPGPGARAVVAIVNRRNSDLTDKADGVLYTSDGRDVEMAVPSTKAFYAQVAAGCLLAIAIADVVGARRGGAAEPSATLLDGAARACPTPWPRCSTAGPTSAASPPSWRRRAGTGRSSATAPTASRPRSCGSSSRSSATSRSPATSPRTRSTSTSRPSRSSSCAPPASSGSTADDVAKEVAIYRAHKAAPIVIATEGEGRFGAALHLIEVPPTHPQLAFVLSAMAGHLFGYEAALAIDGQAVPLRGGPGGDRGQLSSVRRRRASARRCCTRCARRCAPAAGPVLRRAPGRRVRRPPRGVDGHPPGVAAPLRPRHGAARRLPDRARQGRHAGRRHRRPHRRPHPGHRGADPAHRRHQAPGQDRHRRHQPHRRDAAAGAARRRRCSPPGRPATRSATARSRRSPTSIPPSPRSWASSATGSRATRPSTATPPTCVVDRGGVALGFPSRSERDPVLTGHQAHRRPRAGAARRPGPAGRPHDRDRPRGQGRRTTTASRCCTCTSTTACPPARPAASCRATAAGSPPCATPSPRPSRSSARTCWPTSPCRPAGRPDPASLVDGRGTGRSSMCRGRPASSRRSGRTSAARRSW